MQLPGRLRLTTLGDVLGALHRERATGVLELTECAGMRAGRTHRVHLIAGLITEITGDCDRADPGQSHGGLRPFAERQRARLEALFGLTDARIAFRVAGGRREPRCSPLSPADFLKDRPRFRDLAGRPPLRRLRRDPVRERALSTLGLPESASPETVRRAFRALAARLHPDKYPGADAEQREALLRRFAELSRAYHALVA